MTSVNMAANIELLTLSVNQSDILQNIFTSGFRMKKKKYTELVNVVLN